MMNRYKPKNIIEIGCGQSTNYSGEMQAILTSDYAICIEPYEQPWRETDQSRSCQKATGRSGERFFDLLGDGDLLFIDSSHIIRPGGDVLKAYLEIFPQLNKGVIVHVHDIFLPNDYLKNWLVEETLFWNEQYLLEATLGNQSRYRILAALNF